MTRYLEDRLKNEIVDTLKISQDTFRSIGGSTPLANNVGNNYLEFKQLEERISKRMAESIE